MSNYNNVNLYDYNNNVIYPYVQLSSIQIDEYDGVDDVKNYPIHNYIKDCVSNISLDVVDTNTNQTINGVKTFTSKIQGNITNAELAKNAEADENGNNIIETYATKKDLENLPTSEIDLSNYVGDVSIKGNTSINGVLHTNSINLTNDPINGSITMPDDNTLMIEVDGTTVLNCTEINAQGATITADAFYESSDERIKTFKNKIDIDLDKLALLKKSYFIFNTNPTEEHIGVSAQEIQKLFPEIVTKGYDNDLLKVDYSKLSVIALAAIDKLYNENIKLKNDIELIKLKLNID